MTDQSRVIAALIGPGQAKTLIRLLRGMVVLVLVAVVGLLWIGRWLTVERDLADAERSKLLRQWETMNQAMVAQEKRHQSEQAIAAREMEAMRETFRRCATGVRWIERYTDRAGLPSIFEEGADHEPPD